MVSYPYSVHLNSLHRADIHPKNEIYVPSACEYVNVNQCAHLPVARRVAWRGRTPWLKDLKIKNNRTFERFRQRHAAIIKSIMDPVG